MAKYVLDSVSLSNSEIEISWSEDQRVKITLESLERKRFQTPTTTSRKSVSPLSIRKRTHLTFDNNEKEQEDLKEKVDFHKRALLTFKTIVETRMKILEAKRDEITNEFSTDRKKLTDNIKRLQDEFASAWVDRSNDDFATETNPQRLFADLDHVQRNLETMTEFQQELEKSLEAMKTKLSESSGSLQSPLFESYSTFDDFFEMMRNDSRGFEMIRQTEERKS